MKRKIGRIILLIAICLGIEGIAFAEDGSIESPMFSTEYREYYNDYNSLKVYDFEKENKVLDKAIEKCQSNDMVAVHEIGKIGKGTYWIRTNEATDMFYLGRLKDNKPEGKGVLYKKILGLEMGISSDLSDSYYVKYYEGEFKKGKQEGFGREYVSPIDSLQVDGADTDIIPLNLYEEVTDDIQSNLLLTTNPLCYEGYFKNNEYSGKGNRYEYLVFDSMLYEAEQMEELEKALEGSWEEEYNNEEEMYDYYEDGIEEPSQEQYYSKHINVYTGKFKKGKENGKIKVYYHGMLLYDGEMKKGIMDGQGTQYYPESAQIRYKGGWKQGEYNGNGTLYDESGEEEYSGKWNNGEYGE